MDKGFNILNGKGKVMLSAPHAVEQTRDDKIKLAEPETKKILIQLCESLGCSGIYKTKNLNDDANFDENCIYKKFLIDFIKSNQIKYLLDLHQLSPLRTEEINIGTGYGKNIQNNNELLNILVQSFKTEQLTSSIDKPFSASYKNTVSAKIASECGIPTFQLEINTNLLTDKSSFNKVYKAIKHFIKKLEAK